jgi:hypothetical protein
LKDRPEEQVQDQEQVGSGGGVVYKGFTPLE